MYYLKCDNCGYQNELKSGAITLCSGCDKPLDNSFYEWIKLNHEKTFEDYKKEVCTYQEDQIATAPKSSREDWKRALKIILIASAAILGPLIGEHFGKSIVSLFSSGSVKTSKDVLTQTWVKTTYSDFGLTIETPEKLTKDSLPLPDKVKNLIDKMESYTNHPTGGFMIDVNWMKGKSGSILNLQGAANGSINKLKSVEGVTDFNYSENHVTKDSIPEIIQKGTYTAKCYNVEFTNAIYCKGLNLWAATIVYQSDDDIGRTAAKRVIESIKIKN
ncbi:MAG TPA: hypothetical protein VNY36_09980 [Bacteroidia bacterium]|nr:hypothetical protein [Bacteroidia bacterium]